MKSNYFVYLASNEWRTLYVGMTIDLETRMREHKAKAYNGFTRRYSIDRVVYFERQSSAIAAARRERQLKGWTRAKKLALINSFNPEWIDFADSRIPAPCLRGNCRVVDPSLASLAQDELLTKACLRNQSPS
jgi:putative endonuclease